MHQKKLVILSILLLMMVVVSGVSLAKTLTAAMTQEPDGYGPMFTMTAGTTVEGFLEIGAFYRDDNWDVYPGVMEYLPSVEDGTWIVNPDGTMELHWKIRKDVYWHDGTKHTVKDYLLDFEVALDVDVPIATRTVARKIDRIEVINDYEFITYWKELYPFANLSPSSGNHYALPAHILEPVYRNNSKENFINHPFWTTQFIGKGPYKMKEWVPGSHIEMVKNDKFFLAEPKIDRVVMKFITDTETMAVVIKTGEVDVTLPPTILFDTAMTTKQAVDPEKIHVAFIPATTWEHLDMNVRDYPAFRDERVRKALIYGLDREMMVEALFENLQPVAHTYLPENHPLYSTEADKMVTKYEYNPDKALALLAMAGYQRGSDGIMVNDAGEKLIINARTTAGNRPRELALQVIQDMWSQIGVSMEIQVMPSNVLFNNDHFYRRQWPGLILFAWAFQPTSLGDLWHGGQIPTEENGWSGQNVAGYDNPVVTDLVDKILVEMSESKRQEHAAELLKIWSEEVPSIPLWFRVDIATWKTNVTGIKPTGCAAPNSWNTWEWDIK